MIEINNRDMRNEEMGEQLNINNMVEGVQQVLKTLIDLKKKKRVASEHRVLEHYFFNPV